MSSITKVETLSDLDSHMTNRIDDVQVCVNLRGGWAHDTVEDMQQLAKELEGMKQEVASYHTQVTSARQLLGDARTLLTTIRQLSLRNAHLKDHLPQRMPGAPQQQDKHHHKKSSREEEGKGMQSTLAAVAEPKLTSKPGIQKTKQIPKVEFITIDEFESIPSYIRRRLQYEQVNVVVEQFNKVVESKYMLLSKPRAKLSELNMKIVGECRRQENVETKGLYFVVDKDIKRWSSVKLDTAGKTILTILRTLKRLKEVRGPASLVRYAVLN